MRNERATLLLQRPLEEKTLERPLANVLALIEHELREGQEQVIDRISKVEDIEELESVAVKLPLEVAYSEEMLRDRYTRISRDVVKVEDTHLESVVENEAEIVEEDAESVEEYYVGQRVLERLGISAW